MFDPNFDPSVQPKTTSTVQFGTRVEPTGITPATPNQTTPKADTAPTLADLNIEAPRARIQDNVVIGANSGGTQTRSDSLAGVRESAAQVGILQTQVKERVNNPSSSLTTQGLAGSGTAVFNKHLAELGYDSSTFHGNIGQGKRYASLDAFFVENFNTLADGTPLVDAGALGATFNSKSGVVKQDNNARTNYTVKTRKYIVGYDGEGKAIYRTVPYAERQATHQKQGAGLRARDGGNAVNQFGVPGGREFTALGDRIKTAGPDFDAIQELTDVRTAPYKTDGFDPETGIRTEFEFDSVYTERGRRQVAEFQNEQAKFNNTVKEVEAFQASGKNLYDWTLDGGDVDEWIAAQKAAGNNFEFDGSQKDWEKITRESSYYKNDSPLARQIAQEKEKWNSAINSEIERRTSEVQDIPEPLKSELISQIKNQVNSGPLAQQRDEVLSDLEFNRKDGLRDVASSLKSSYDSRQSAKAQTYAQANNEADAKAEWTWLENKRREVEAQGIDFELNRAYYKNQYKELSKYTKPEDFDAAESLATSIADGSLDIQSSDFGSRVYESFGKNIDKSYDFIKDYKGKGEADIWQQEKYQELGFTETQAKKESTVNGGVGSFRNLYGEDTTEAERKASQAHLDQLRNNNPKEWFIARDLYELETTNPDATESEKFAFRQEAEKDYEILEKEKDEAIKEFLSAGDIDDYAPETRLALEMVTRAQEEHALENPGERITADQVLTAMLYSPGVDGLLGDGSSLTRESVNRIIKDIEDVSGQKINITLPEVAPEPTEDNSAWYKPWSWFGNDDEKKKTTTEPVASIDGIDGQRGLENIIRAETGTREDRFIRTGVEVEGELGSSAYGPAQITQGLVQNYKNKEGFFTDEEAEFADKFISQGQKFLQYEREGKNDDPVYGLEGSGEEYFRTEEGKKLYNTVAQKLWDDHLNRAGGDQTRAAEMWRGKKKEEDPRYFSYINDQDN